MPRCILWVLVGLSLMVSGEDCNGIIKYGVYNSYHQELLSTEFHTTMCSCDKTYGYNDYTGEQLSPVSASMKALLLLIGPVKAEEEVFQEKMATISFYQETFCQGTPTYAFTGSYIKTLSHTIDPEVVEAWQNCITLTNKGVKFNTHIPGDNTATMDLWFDPVFPSSCCAWFNGISTTAECNVINQEGFPVELKPSEHINIFCKRRYTQPGQLVSVHVHTNLGTIVFQIPPLQAATTNSTALAILQQGMAQLEAALQETQTQCFEKTDQLQSQIAGLSQSRPTSCSAAVAANSNKSGVYELDINGATLSVECTSDGFAIVQKRIDGSVDFFRPWNDYVSGFGSPGGEVWIGLENLHILSSKLPVLRVMLWHGNGTLFSEKYTNFRVLPGSTLYTLQISGPSGNAGDSMEVHNGNMFSTYDSDHDRHSSMNCAQEFDGAWWYGKCHHANLNGKWFNGQHAEYASGINWLTAAGHSYSFPHAEMQLQWS